MSRRSRANGGRERFLEQSNPVAVLLCAVEFAETEISVVGAQCLAAVPAVQSHERAIGVERPLLRAFNDSVAVVSTAKRPGDCEFSKVDSWLRVAVPRLVGRASDNAAAQHLVATPQNDQVALIDPDAKVLDLGAVRARRPLSDTALE